MLGVLPYQEDGVENWHEEVSNIVKLFGWIDEFFEKIIQCLEVLKVLVGF